MKRIVPLLAGVCLLMALFVTPAMAVPPLPHAFYGTVDINGDPAPIGTQVEAQVEGVVTGEGNPITVTEAGKYGGPGGLDPKLVVQGEIEGGATVTFYVDGVAADQTWEWHSGDVKELNLTVTSAPPGELISISVSPTSLDFGSVEAGQSSSAEQLTVTNNGTVAISVTADTVNDEGDFYRASLTLDSQGLDVWVIDSLDVGESQVIEVVLTVSAEASAGERIATLIFSAELP